METKNCDACGDEIPLGRLKAIPTTKRCVKCSNVKAKRPVILTLGEGEDTFNETIFLESDDYDKYMEVENKLYKKELLTPINVIEKQLIEKDLGE